MGHHGTEIHDAFMVKELQTLVKIKMVLLYDCHLIKRPTNFLARGAAYTAPHFVHCAPQKALYNILSTGRSPYRVFYHVLSIIEAGIQESTFAVFSFFKECGHQWIH